MRLGQLARKLSLRPSQIIEFLAQQNIQIEDNSNTRIEDHHVETIVRHFAPASLAQIITEPDEPEQAKENVEMNLTEEPAVVEEPLPETDETKPAEPEVIRVQKIELSGLKVLGKIELPEPKKKEQAQETPEEGAPATEKPSLDKRKPKHPKDRRQQRPSKNPVEQQREREARAAEDKRRAETEREKEKRKKHYEEKRKSQLKPKRLKVSKEKQEVYKKIDTRPVPNTWFGKFLRWWTT